MGFAISTLGNTPQFNGMINRALPQSLLLSEDPVSTSSTLALIILQKTQNARFYYSSHVKKKKSHAGRNQAEYYYGDSISGRVCKMFVILQAQS